MPCRAVGRPSEPAREAAFECQVTRIANARPVTFGLAGAFFVLSLAGAIVMRFTDADNFPSLGLAFWWNRASFPSRNVHTAPRWNPEFAIIHC
jgi:hypothetical protein